MPNIIGLRVDLTEIPRIVQTIERYGDRFLRRIFTEGEIAYCMRRKHSAIHFAGRFASTAPPRPRRSGTRFDPAAGMTIKITPNEKGTPAGKLAEAEIHFSDGPLQGLKLIGFSVWERRGGNGRNVTFPARSYVVNG